MDELTDSVEDNEETDMELADIHVDPLGGLKPRQRRLAHLLASGKTNAQIQEELGYCASRISILQNHPLIKKEVARLQDRLFEETIETRIKNMNEAALNHLDFVLNDRTNRVKVTEKNEIAKWVVEMQKSKAPQVHDVGQNLLSLLHDKLDAKKTERKVVQQSSLAESSDLPVIDIETKAVPQIAAPPSAEDTEDSLARWVDDFCAES